MNTMITPTVRLAGTFGMDADARSALAKLETLSRSGSTGVAGVFMPDPGVSRKLAGLGVAEGVEEADFFRYRRIVIPFTGTSPKKRREWEKAGVPLADLTAPLVRRAQVALGLLRMDGAQALVIGRHHDPETKGLLAGNPGARVIEDTTDTARLTFSPSFGAVCQTTLSPRRVAWLVQQLRHRYNDAKVTFLDTASPAMAARDQALEKIITTCDRVVIVGRKGEASTEALAETALRKGKASLIVSGAAGLEEIGRGERIAVSAGAFVLDAAVREVVDTLSRR